MHNDTRVTGRGKRGLRLTVSWSWTANTGASQRLSKQYVEVVKICRYRFRKLQRFQRKSSSGSTIMRKISSRPEVLGTGSCACGKPVLGRLHSRENLGRRRPIGDELLLGTPAKLQIKKKYRGKILRGDSI
jgi:phosphate starvation-inducible protein PhoH